MESVIREGALRLLTAETSCDVILSCQGHRLMAHKLILSMASPVFRALLSEDCSDPTVFILPDINGSIMSLILDFIYTGNVIVYSNTIQDFIAVARLLKIHVDMEYSKAFLPSKSKIFHRSTSPTKCHFDEDLVKRSEETHYKEKVESLDIVSASNPEVYSKKNQRKLPNLLPINEVPIKEKIKPQRKLCSYVLPSPWCPRIERVFGDPRNDCLETYENQISPTVRPIGIEENDSNNNFKHHQIHTPLKYNIQQGNNVNDINPDIYENHLKQSGIIPKTPTLNILSFNSHILKRINTDAITRTISKKQEDFDDHKRKINDLLIQDPKKKVHTTLESVPKCMTGEVSKEETVTDKNDANDSIQTTIKDSDSSQSNSDGELYRPDEDTKDKKPFKCEDCGKCFSQLRNYKYHRSVHEGTKEFAAKCPECGKNFNDKGYLSSHMKIHRDKKEYACPHCPKRFNQRVAYNMHLRIHTGVKPHECSVCGKSFSRKMLLKQHQRVHTGERPYSCPECGKTFADRSNMSLHARLHTGVKPYSCNMCTKSFTKKHHLKTHMNFHTGLKPYNCEKCGLAFSQSSNMRTHYKKCILKSDMNNSSVNETQKDSS